MCDVHREREQLVSDPDGTICRIVRFGAGLNTPLGKVCTIALLVRLVLQGRAVVGDEIRPYA